MLPIEFLSNFSSDELTELYYGDTLQTNWQLHELQEHILPAHGYTKDSVIF